LKERGEKKKQKREAHLVGTVSTWGKQCVQP